VCACVYTCAGERESVCVCKCVKMCLRINGAECVFHFPVVLCVRERLSAYRYIDVDICMEIYFLWVHAWREYDLS